MNRKISEFPRIPALQDGYLVPAVRDGVSFVFDTASLKSYLTKADMGLSAVDNTSDINKPISTATQTAISGLSAILFNKTDVGHPHSTSDISGLANMFSGYSRTNHTHTVADITDLVLPNMSLYATVQDVLARTTEARVLQLITQNTTGAVDLGPTNVRIDNAIIRIAGAEANVVQNQITANTHSTQISSVSNRVDALEATGLDTADLQTINNQFAVLTNSLSAKASITHTHTTSQITDFAATVGNLISSVVNVNAINADLNGIHADLLAIYTSLDGKAATTHIHAISSITGLQAALDAKSGITHVHDFNGVTGLQTALDSKAPTGHTHTEYAPTAHNHTVANVTGLQATLDGKAATDHTHTEYAASVHTHVITDTIGLEAELASKAEASHAHNDYAPIVHAHSISSVTGLQATLDTLTGTLGHTHAVADITGLLTVLETKTDVGHEHIVGNITDLQTELDSKADASHLHTEYADIAHTHTDYAAVSHNHSVSNVIGLQTALDDKATTGHGHSVTDISGLQAGLDAKAGVVHIHGIADVTGLQTALVDINDQIAQIASSGGSGSGTSAPLIHTHALIDIIGLQAALDAKASSIHGHVVSDVTGLQTVLDSKTSIGHVHETSDITGLDALLASVLGEFAVTSGSIGDASYNNVVLLLHGNGTNGSSVITDSSPIVKNVTTLGNTSLTTTESKFDGSSIYFNGNGDYLTVPYSDDWTITGDYTIECYFNRTPIAGSTLCSIISNLEDASQKGWRLDTSPQASSFTVSFAFYLVEGGVQSIATTNTFNSSMWHHTAVVFYGNQILLFVNGVLQTSAARVGTPSISLADLAIGRQEASQPRYFNGYLDEVRITKGVARYTTNFTPFTQAFPDVVGDLTDANFADVALLLHGDGANGTNSFADSSSFPGTLTTVGSVVHTTTYKKFGTSSIQTSDKNSKIQVVKDVAIDLTASYTIECFVRTNSNTNVDYNSIITTNDNVFPGRFGLDFGVTGSNTLVARIVTASNSTVFSATNAYTLGNLIHIAFVNDSVNNLFKIFIGGVLSGTRAAVPFFNTNVFQIGKCSTNWAETPYQIDELRITKNVVRYLTNFTPPTTAFANAAPIAPTYGNLATVLASKASLVHTHAIADTTGLQTALDAKASSVHGHVVADVTGLQTVLDNKASVGHTHTEYAAILHNHALIDITGLQTALDAKASVNHTHVAANITDFNSVVTDIIDQQIIASNSSAVDTYYSNVVLLLHGTGANNSTTIVDSSTSPKSISVIGNTVISTSQSKFNGSSLYFDGSGDYLNIATSQDFDLGDIYTIEFFVYNLNATAVGGILHKGYYSSITHLWSGFAFSIRGLGAATRFYFYASTNADEQYIDVPASLPQNAWQHVAMVRNGSSGAVYLDGTLSGAITGLNTTAPSTEALRVGLWDFNGASEYFNGHLAEVRVTKGVARYTTAFTPPAIEFPNTNSVGGTPGMLTTTLTGLNTAISNLSTQISTNADGLGYSQSWQTVTRVSGTTYVNTTGKPIVFCYSAHVFINTYVDISVSLDGVVTPVRASYGQGHTGTAIPVWCSAVIPVGAHYTPYTNGTFFQATELR